MVAQSLKLFLVVIAVLQVVSRANTANPVQDEHVITATNTSLGVKVAVLSRIRRRQQLVFTFENHSLSSGCGPQFWRCQNVLVKRYPILQQYVIFVPLDNAIGIMDFRYREEELLLHAYYVTPLSLTEVSCNPAGLFDILRSTYIVCLKSSDLVVYEIVLNRTHITNTLRHRRTAVHLPDSLNLLSNIVFISLGNLFDQKHLFFTVGIDVYKITPHEYVIQMVGTLRDSGTISVPCTIAAAGGQTMIANCEQVVIYFDLIYESWINRTTYSQSGQPFICPNPDVRLAVFPASYIQHGLWSRNTHENINIPGLEFDSGVCFGTQNKTLFAYIDRKDGVYVLELLTSNFKQLSSKSCLNGHCDPLLIFDNKYIVLRERNDSTITVVDSKLSRIIEATDLTADLVAMIPYLEVTISSSSTTEGTASTSTVTISSTSTTEGTASTSTVTISSTSTTEGTASTSTVTISSTTTTEGTASTSTITGIGGGNFNLRDSLKPGSKAIVGIAVPLVIVCLLILVIVAAAASCWRWRKNTARINFERPSATNPLRQSNTGGSDQPLADTSTRRRPSVVGGNVAAEPENFSDEGRDLDIDYPIEVEGSDAPESPVVGSTASTASNSHSAEDGDNQAEVATLASLRREEHRPEGSSHEEDLDITTSTVPCSEDHPILLSAHDGVFCASINSTNGSVTSQSGDQAIAPHLESVRETDESLRGTSQSGDQAIAPHLESVRETDESLGGTSQSGDQAIAPHLESVRETDESLGGTSQSGDQAIAPHLESVRETDESLGGTSQSGDQAIAPHLESVRETDESLGGTSQSGDQAIAPHLESVRETDESLGGTSQSGDQAIAPHLESVRETDESLGGTSQSGDQAIAPHLESVRETDESLGGTSQSGDQAIAPHLESVRETDESHRGTSQNDASNTMTALEYQLSHTENSNSLSRSSHVPVAPTGTSTLPPDHAILPQPVTDVGVNEASPSTSVHVAK